MTPALEASPSCDDRVPKCPPVPNLRALRTELPLQHDCFHHFLMKRHCLGDTEGIKLEKLTLASEGLPKTE